MKRFLLITIFFIIGTAVLFIYSFDYSFLVFMVLLWFAIINIGVFYFRSGIFFPTHPTKKIPGKIVLTFDDGPDPQLTEDILSLLKQFEYQATFFLVGKDAEKYPDLVKKIIENGHTIASHSYDHLPWMNFYLCKPWQQQLKKTEQALSPYLTQKWFRPPYGLMSPHLASALTKEKYQLIIFHIRALDFGNRKISNLSDRLLRTIHKGGVVMLHAKLAKNSGVRKNQLLEQFYVFFSAIKARHIEVVSLDKYTL